MGQRIGILTGGGDAPGLNGIIEASARLLLNAGYEMVGIEDGFEGVFQGRVKPIRVEDLAGLHAKAGTFLGTSNKSRIEGDGAEFRAKFEKLGLHGLIAAGGDGTFSALSRLGPDFPLIGVPKTIDNDVPGTEITFGYDTAVSVVSEAVDALRATADAHSRVMVIEAMGRTAGWIALGGGLASYAEVILIPERPFSREKLAEFLRRKRKDHRGLIVVVSEAARAEGEDPTVAFRVEKSFQPERFGGIAEKLARWIEKEVDWEARHVVLGHLQRSAAPTTTDRFLTQSMGVHAGKMVQSGKWGYATVYRAGRIKHVPIQEIMGKARTVDPQHPWVRRAQALDIFI
jgi:6-phosphofructokinase 1